MWRDLRKSFHDLDRERMLEMIGLERRRNAAQRVLPIVALFGVGLVVGVGVGMMVAPRTGRELREDLKGRFQQQLPKAAELIHAAADKLENPHASAPHA